MTNPYQNAYINTFITAYPDAFKPEGTAPDNDYYEEIRILKNIIEKLEDPTIEEIQAAARQWYSSVSEYIKGKLMDDAEVLNQLYQQQNVSIPTTRITGGKSWQQIKEERQEQQQDASIPTTRITGEKSWQQIKEERQAQQQDVSIPTTIIQGTKNWKEKLQEQIAQQYKSVSIESSTSLVNDILDNYQQFCAKNGGNELNSWLKPSVHEYGDGMSKIQFRFSSIEEHNKFIADLVNQQQDKVGVNMIVRGHDKEIIATVTNGQIDIDPSLGAANENSMKL